jgi:MFS family permease
MGIEAEVRRQWPYLPPATGTVRIALKERSGFNGIMNLFTGAYRTRALLCLLLMTAQAFFYNSVFFSMTLVLIRFYGLTASRVGYVFLPIAFMNFLGPALLARAFDRLGRRSMIAGTFCLSGALLLTGSWLFYLSRLTAGYQIAWWSITFFFASSAAGSAYLTVGEVFPQEIRATTIAFFYAFGTFAGGVFGPLVFGHLIGNGSRAPLFCGYAIAALGMIGAGVAQAVWGVSFVD